MRTRRSASSSSDPVSSSEDLNRRHQTTPRQEAKPFEALAEKGRPKSFVGVGHTPVLLHETLLALQIRPDDVVLDATLGGAGHAKAIFSHLGESGVLIGIDADAAAVERAKKALSAAKPRIYLEVNNFRNLKSVLEHCGVAGINSAFFDLGWSGYQVAAGKGFSFQPDEPLLMVYGETSEGALTASTIVHTWGEGSIADILYGWGEERYAKRIAHAIVAQRARRPIETARELADIIARAVPAFYRKGRLHPATKTFQALRIAVNDEIGALKEGLSAAWSVLSPGGRIVVISFHSVEDREVKRLMLEWAKTGEGERITESPIRPSREEILKNPRARSAKLRVIKKLS